MCGKDRIRLKTNNLNIILEFKIIFWNAVDPLYMLLYFVECLKYILEIS
jgi:hypothetical protein